MRRFRFPLQRLLWYRGLQESLARQAAAQAAGQHRELEAALEATRGRAGEHAARLASELERPMSGPDFALRARWAAELAERQAGLARRRDEAAGRLAQQRAVLQERWRARQVVARLRARAAAAHRAAEGRAAQLVLDEVAALRHLRRKLRGPEGSGEAS